MTETTTTLPKPPTETTTPNDILTNVIIAFLMPMFLTTNGDIALARAAAIQTVNAYRARDDADLIAIAQIIAFGLAALGSLCLSMAGDLTLNMTLRLRGNANALNRSAEQNRRTLAHRHPSPAQQQQTEPRFDPGTDPFQAATLADLAETDRRSAEVLAARRAPEPPPEQPAAQTPTTTPTPTDSRLFTETKEQQKAMWAAAATKVAGEFTTSLPYLPPVERRMASLRAAALGTSASNLLTEPLPPRLRPGDLDVLFRPRAP
jgi:hypothetical protein